MFCTKRMFFQISMLLLLISNASSALLLADNQYTTEAEPLTKGCLTKKEKEALQATLKEEFKKDLQTLIHLAATEQKGKDTKESNDNQWPKLKASAVSSVLIRSYIFFMYCKYGIPLLRKNCEKNTSCALGEFGKLFTGLLLVDAIKDTIKPYCAVMNKKVDAFIETFFYGSNEVTTASA